MITQILNISPIWEIMKLLRTMNDMTSKSSSEMPRICRHKVDIEILTQITATIDVTIIMGTRGSTEFGGRSRGCLTEKAFPERRDGFQRSDYPHSHVFAIEC